MTPWTPALSLFFGLQVALGLMRDEGLERLFERHRRLAQYTREGLADHVVVVRSEHIPRIQEAQASAYHALRELVG